MINPNTTRPSAKAMKINACDAISGFSLIAPMAAEPTLLIAIPAAIAPTLNAIAAAITTHFNCGSAAFSNTVVSAANNGGAKTKAERTSAIAVAKNERPSLFLNTLVVTMNPPNTYIPNNGYFAFPP